MLALRDLARILSLFYPLGELAFTNAPLSADLESGELAKPNHAFYRPRGFMQQLGSLPESEKTERLAIIFHIGFPARSNANAMTQLGRFWKTLEVLTHHIPDRCRPH